MASARAMERTNITSEKDTYFWRQKYSGESPLKQALMDARVEVCVITGKWKWRRYWQQRTSLC